MELLSLSESEVDPIINEMVDYVTFSRKHSKLFDNSTIGYFEPDRQTDSDILWLKLSQISSLWTKKFVGVSSAQNISCVVYRKNWNKIDVEIIIIVLVTVGITNQ